MKAATAPMMLPNRMPTSGTISTERSGIERRMRRNIAVPASAKTEATSIRTKIGVSGATSVTARMPRLAESTVPTVDGSTKRLRAIICMIVPATAIDTPASMIAAVRGMRLASMICAAWLSPPWPNRARGEMSLTPTNRLTSARQATSRMAAAIFNAMSGRGFAGTGRWWLAESEDANIGR